MSYAGANGHYVVASQVICPSADKTAAIRLVDGVQGCSICGKAV